ncbi:hypothetical protein TNCV_3438301 [Trichonephila clavipes]|nr:hypothetical protein TNCV_3438301 [Trichonephila clavipes]
MDPPKNNQNKNRSTDKKEFFCGFVEKCLNIIKVCDSIEKLCKSVESSSTTSKGSTLASEGETSASDGAASAWEVKQADVKPQDSQQEPKMPTKDVVIGLLEELAVKLEEMRDKYVPGVVLEEKPKTEDKE